MKLFAVMMIANESDIIEYTIRHLFSQGIDGIIVCDHMSTDATPDILRAIQQDDPRLWVVNHTEPAFYQGKILTSLANIAYAAGAEWVFGCDADELWYPFDQTKTVRQILEETDVQCVGAPMWNHYCTSEDTGEHNPFWRIRYRHIDQNPLDKCAVRFKPGMVIDEGNHRILPATGPSMSGVSCGLGIRHFSARDETIFVRKSVLAGNRLNQTTLNPGIGAHVRQYAQTVADHGEEALRQHYQKWFTFDLKANPDAPLIYDPAPYTGGPISCTPSAL